LLNLDVEGAQVLLVLGCLALLIHTMTFHVHLGSLLGDHIPGFHEINGVINELSWNTCSDSNISCVEIHVTSLNTFNRESS